MGLTRSALIERALFRAGRKGAAIDLTGDFDALTMYMSVKYPLLRNGYFAGNTTEDQAYVDLPPDYRSSLPEETKWKYQESMYMESAEGTKWQLTPENYEDYINFIRRVELITQKPWHYSINSFDKRIYLRYTPDLSTYAYYFYYCQLHPKAGRKVAFTSGGTYQIKVGDTVTGETGGATGVVSAILLSSGSWIGEDAAGYLILSSQTGTFQAETLKVGANLNAATIAGDSATANNFTHCFDDEFDEVLVNGLLWKVYQLLEGPQAEETLAWMGTFESDLSSKVMNKLFRFKGSRSNFWNAGAWDRRS